MLLIFDKLLGEINIIQSAFTSELMGPSLEGSAYISFVIP